LALFAAAWITASFDRNTRKAVSSCIFAATPARPASVEREHGWFARGSDQCNMDSR
jgi:hypothetical protein